MGGSIRVVCSSHVDSPGPRSRNQGCAFRSSPVVRRTLGVEVAEDDLRAGLLPNSNALFDGAQLSERRIRRAEIAVMRIVDRARILGRHLVQFDDFFGLRVVPWEIEESGREAVGTLVHTFANEASHGIELLV